MGTGELVPKSLPKADTIGRLVLSRIKRLSQPAGPRAMLQSKRIGDDEVGGLGACVKG